MTTLEWILQIESSLVVQIVVFFLLAGGILHLQLQLRAVIRQLTSERVGAILKVTHVADDLAKRVERIAEKIRLDTTAITHELAGKAENSATVRDQIDAIKQSTDALVNGKS